MCDGTWMCRWTEEEVLPTVELPWHYGHFEGFFIKCASQSTDTGPGLLFLPWPDHLYREVGFNLQPLRPTLKTVSLHCDCYMHHNPPPPPPHNFSCLLQHAREYGGPIFKLLQHFDPVFAPKFWNAQQHNAMTWHKFLRMMDITFLTFTPCHHRFTFSHDFWPRSLFLFCDLDSWQCHDSLSLKGCGRSHL